jgi:dipeptide transport system ATP-binding protein
MLLTIRNLSISFGALRAVEGLDLTVQSGEVLGVVGESGSGKSVSMLAIMGLLPPHARVTADELSFDGTDLRSLAPKARRHLLGRDIAMVFQDPMTSLNPCFPVGWQIGETLTAHQTVSRRLVRTRVIALLEQVGIPSPESRLRAFPHQLSGGMNQRVMIAMAIACNPRLLIADEPTTALDVTIQKQILDLLVALQQQRGMALVLITHDMGVVAQTAQRVQVMYAGQAVEQGEVQSLLTHPRHPYSAALLAALPERSAGQARLPILPGVVPGLEDRPLGCLFNPRCTYATEQCRQTAPGFNTGGSSHARCFYPLT